LVSQIMNHHGCFLFLQKIICATQKLVPLTLHIPCKLLTICNFQWLFSSSSPEIWD
jgi:hypothetical protein